ncbi:MAG: hypothetical protein U0163_03415 [Gemmatimonadaceae bacterium]
MPTIAVNRDGVVAVLWYEQESPETASYRVRVSASSDGGMTWAAAMDVSAAPNDQRQQRPAVRAPVNAGGYAPEPGTFSATGGDTAGLVADTEGRFHAAWIDNRTGVQQVWTAIVTVSQR